MQVPDDAVAICAVNEKQDSGGVPIIRLVRPAIQQGSEAAKLVCEVLEGRKVNPLTRVIVTPASARIYKKALRNGLIEIFMDAGCTVTGTGCGACIGRHGGILAPGERALTTMNRNFVGRMGSPLSEIYLASPATAAATALTGRITDPRSIL